DRRSGAGCTAARTAAGCTEPRTAASRTEGRAADRRGRTAADHTDPRGCRTGGSGRKSCRDLAVRAADTPGCPTRIEPADHVPYLVPFSPVRKLGAARCASRAIRGARQPPTGPAHNRCSRLTSPDSFQECCAADVSGVLTLTERV